MFGLLRAAWVAAPLAFRAAKFLRSAIPFVVMPSASSPSMACRAAVRSTKSLRKVGSPPVSLILVTPALTNSFACDGVADDGAEKRCSGVLIDRLACGVLRLAVLRALPDG